MLHLVTAAAWVGGLVPLLMFVAPRTWSQQPPLIDCFNMLRRFSTLAAWSVTVLAASGVLNTWFMTNGLRSFLGTDYGNLVLVKIALFTVMLALARPIAIDAAIAPDQRAYGKECEGTAAALHFGFD
jgi:putative copper resistance protein D